MNKIIADLILLFGVCLFACVFYWQVCYPVILKSIRFHLFEMRDYARSIAAERGLANDYVFMEIERFICKTIAIAPSINLMSFIWFVSHKGKSADNAEYERFSKEAPQEFIGIRDVTARCAISTMMLNSPWEVFLSVVLVPILWGFGKISHLRTYQATEEFVDNIEFEATNRAPSAC